MKLKEFNANNCFSSKRRSEGAPCIAINVKVGLFRFNKPATELLGLDEGDQVLFHQDEEDPENWYIEKVDKNGFEVRIKAAIGKGVLFNNTALARQIFSSVLFNGLSGKCLLAGQPTEFKKRKLFGLITSNLRNQ